MNTRIETYPANQRYQIAVAIATWLETHDLDEVALAIRPAHRRYVGFWRYGPNTGCRRGATDVLLEEIPALGARLDTELKTAGAVIDTESAQWSPTVHMAESILERREAWERAFTEAERIVTEQD